MREAFLVALCAAAVCVGEAAAAAAETAGARTEAFSVESAALRLAVGSDARAIAFIDKASGADYCASLPGAAFVSVKKGGKLLQATQARRTDGGAAFGFADAGIGVALKITGTPHGIVVEVLEVAGDGVQECLFAHVPLTLKGRGDEPFAACALALNLQTEVRGLPEASRLLEARCYPRFGLAGAKVALAGAPQADLRRVLQELVTASSDLPRSPIGGPWALDADVNRGSYLFAPVSEANADAWIQLALSLGLSQIDFDGMSRYGDAEPYPALYPNGRAGLKSVVAKVHAAGLKAGLHTYAFFIDKKCPWVTPVPDARLGKAATFTLAEALGETNRCVVVSESTADRSAITGFFVRNSATLQVDDELMTFSEVSQKPPFTFAHCVRGACGTRPAPHAQGAKVVNLKECFGRFTPDAESSLLAEVAARQAQTVNDCGFDMMYIDALDGEDILGGRENSWHYGSQFVFELWKRFDHPVLLEMSTMHHHLWNVRSRYGAWDHPTRSHKRFIDLHCSVNANAGRMTLPMHLGWWALKTWSGPQGEPTFPDDIEYLCCKALGHDVGFSLMGVTPDTFAKNATLQRLGGLTRSYEALRHARAFPESLKARLRVPGDEFTLDLGSCGKPRLRPAMYAKHVFARRSTESATWSVTNAFAEQPLRLRLELLMSAEPYDSTNAITLAAFTAPDAFTDKTQAPGVTASLSPSAALLQAGGSSGLLAATNTLAARRGSWAGFGQTMTPPLNLGAERALGVWVHGDGQGEVLNFQLECPRHVVAGLGEHYVVVDFTGWRYFELIEPEGERFADYAWPYGGPYAIYRERVDYKQIASFKVWVNNLPAQGSAACSLSPVRAVPLVKAKIRNPRLTVGGRTLMFPVEMESGSYLEFHSARDCKVFGPDGNLLREVAVAGEIPALAEGPNALEFGCDSEEETSPRVRITTLTAGAPLPN